MKNIGVVGVPGAWSTEALADALERRTGFGMVVDLSEAVLDLSSGRVQHRGRSLNDLDGLIIKKVGARYGPEMLDRLEICRHLSDCGVSVFSHPRRIMGVVDRLSCTLSLTRGNIPMPPTTVTGSVEEALGAVQHYGRAVLKPLYSSKARGMVLVTPGPDARETVSAFAKDNPVIYVQKYLDLGGEDMGIVFLGGQYLTTYARCAGDNAWNTTIRAGGRYKAFDPPDAVIDIARRAQDLFGLDFTCVDVALTDNGPVVFEVSAFGGFKGILKARGMDAADRYAGYVLEQISRRHPGV